MLVVPTELRSSSIHGVGVFLLKPVKKGDLIWSFDSRIDRVYSMEEIENLPWLAKGFIQKYTTLHRDPNLLLLCGDDARFFNHSDNPTTLSLGSSLSDDVAAHDLAAGTELTCDYRTICDLTSITGRL